MRVLIPDGESGHTLAVAQSLLLNKEITICLSATIDRPASKFLNGCKTFKQISKSDDESYLKSILQFAEEQNVDVILPVDEDTGKFFSKHKEYIERQIPIIPVPEIETFNIATNKRLLAEFCAFNGIPVPKTWSLSDFQTELDSNVINLFPIIIKPECGNGGKKIKLIKTKEEFLSLDFSVKDNEFGNYFVQEFIVRYDIDMSVLCIAGEIKAFTIQKAILGRKSTFAAAAGIEFLEENDLKNVVSELMAKLNYSGIAHLDFRFDKNKNEFKLIEINSRFWGSLMGSTKAGINFPYLSCLASLNQKIDNYGFKKNRYFDFFSLLKRPRLFLDLNIKINETNLEFILKGFYANIVNYIQRN